jgi:hypothetical protein
MIKKLLLILLFPITLFSQTYPIVEEFNAGTTWTYTNGAGLQNYGGAENYATFNIGSTPYPNNSNITITSPTYNFTSTCSSNLTVSFPIVGRIENGFDFVYFQYFDGGVWVTQSTFTGIQNSTPSYSIPNTATQFRFLMVTDCSVNGYKGGNPSCNLSVGTCTPAVGNCSGLTSVYYYDITRFTINCATPLPISIFKYDVSYFENNILVEWVTISENNNDYFTVEKSNNGVDWNVIGTLPGNNSFIYKKYKFIDKEPCSGYNYYRLSQTDFDGEQTYIGIRVILCENEVEAEYYNMQGIKVDINNSPNGIYIKKYNNQITKIIK